MWAFKKFEPSHPAQTRKPGSSEAALYSPSSIRACETECSDVSKEKRPIYGLLRDVIAVADREPALASAYGCQSLRQPQI